MKKIIIILLLGVFACENSKEAKLIHNLAHITTAKKLDSLLFVLDATLSLEKRYKKTYKSKGIHYNQIPIRELYTYEKEGGYIFYTDSIQPEGKTILKELVEDLGMYKKEVDAYNESDSLYTWKNKYREIELDNYKTNYESITYFFSETYKSPIANASENIKKYTTEPVYYLEVTSNYSKSVLLVNNVNVYETNDSYNKNFSLNKYLLNGNEVIEIAFLIPEKGKNIDELKLDVRLIKKIGKEKIVSKLIKKELLATDKLNEKKIVYTYENEIPYNIKGWAKGEDLSKVKNLERMIENLYKKLGESILKGDEETINKMMYQYEFENLQLKYDDSYEASRDKWVGWLANTLNTYKYTTSKDFKIEISPNKQLGYTYSEDLSNMLIITGKGESKSFDYYFYLPKGSNELKIIR